MISITRKEYDREFIQKGYEEFTEDQFRKWIDLNSEILVKGEQGMLEDDLEKAEYEGFKEEIRSFTAVEVVEPSPISQFRIQKSIMYVRPKQVEWDEPELIKGEDGEEIEKARSGKYTDTPLNRKLGRVGQKYGGEKTDVTSSDKEKIKEGFKNPHGMNISNDTETRQAVAKHTKDHIKKLHEERKAKPEGKNQESKSTFKVTGLRDGKRVEISGKPLTNEAAKEMIEDAKKSGLYSDIRLGESESSNSTTDDKGKSEKKQSETKRSIKELEDLHPSEMSFKEFERLRGSQGTYNGSDMERSVLKRLYDKKVQEKK